MTWSGQWVADRLGVGLEGDPELTSLLGLAVRRNKKRAHLLVSHVLGKHVPAAPSAVYGSGVDLGRRVRALLGDEDAARAVVLGYAETATGLGHAVADGLALAPYLHSTRRPVAGVRPVGGFEEEHSHATSHLLLPEDPELLAGDGPLVLVDDEFSTGRTVLNTITTLHAVFPRERYVVVALVDMRSAADRARLDDFAAGLGARVDLIALASGTVRLPEGVLERGQELVARYEARAADGFDGGRTRTADAPSARPARLTRVDVGWPEGLPDGGRHGFTPGHRARLEAALPGMAARVADALATTVAAPTGRGTVPVGTDATLTGGGTGLAGPDMAPAGVGTTRVGTAEAPTGKETILAGPDAAPAGMGTPPATAVPAPTGSETPAGPDVPPGTGPAPRRVLVLGNEELMYAPLRLAAALQDVLQETRPGTTDVRFSTTTRSPVLPVDDPGYAIRTRLAFPAHDDPADGPGERYAYNVAGAGFDAVVAVVDSAADTPGLHAPGGLLDRLGAHTGHVVLVAVPSYAPEVHTPMPEPLRGPAFSSYDPADVGWLLQDLSDVTLEAPTEEREEAIQSGGAHYAESLPVEYQPSADYQALFHAALDASAARMARAVGVVTETVLAERSPRPVLVSLARAGTPVGVLMRRWARHAHGLDLPHYAVSIVRGRGIDPVALRWLAAHHDPADVVFVDGWTGKGAITRELAEALRGFDGFDPRIAVLADPGHCVDTYGTRDDFLIPSACLNSTVSGLISRTVLRADLVGPHDFHGAKFYRELAGADVSRAFLDTVAARFAEVEEDVAADVKELAAADRAPTWEGWAAVERISEEYGIHDVNLVKPGVGETTRVLLRRVPWKILAQRGAGSDLDHVRLLAEQRGVPVEEADGLPYSCVGLIHPRYTRGATGADGKAVTAP
ncbi:phosphoribosyltransferase [Streptomyces sp. HU2014]|uniref:phosphoribosyltransferase domain-containing protein n=1 Tax=Streptomyces sp. HU2014 TaxID=2939414 RepID=UPI00200FC5B7|nr:phosphoribosyltransferase domain-containing protein [Streptomyces sp. HU2014]UQI43857.1 phosphoribosyltransferase [Streptomyces sp. HU2014]